MVDEGGCRGARGYTQSWLHHYCCIILCLVKRVVLPLAPSTLIILFFYQLDCDDALCFRILLSRIFRGLEDTVKLRLCLGSVCFSVVFSNFFL